MNGVNGPYRRNEELGDRRKIETRIDVDGSSLLVDTRAPNRAFVEQTSAAFNPRDGGGETLVERARKHVVDCRRAFKRLQREALHDMLHRERSRQRGPPN
jgi:hypothetical protein